MMTATGLLLVGASSCQDTKLELTGYACHEGRCLAGYYCDTASNRCLPGTGEQACTLGRVETCASCSDDCLAHDRVAAALCVEEAGGFACQITACAPGWIDADHNAGTGCELACVPTGVETCDGADNDCDGSPDNVGQDDLNAECDIEVPDAFVSLWTCVSGQCAVSDCASGRADANGRSTDGCEYECTVSATPTEVCDGADNDCNGETDDVLPDRLAVDCDVENPGAQNLVAWRCNVGQCGVATCVPGFVDKDQQAHNGCEEVCVAQGSEVCDNEDDDCNGTVDDVAQADIDAFCQSANQSAVQVAAWACASGDCAIAGCTTDYYDMANGLVDGCEYHCVKTNPETETCDGADNDCDGQADKLDSDLDAQVELNSDCSGKHTQAVHVANWDCVAGACTIAACDSEYFNHQNGVSDGCEYYCHPVDSGIEKCDGEDNDCNGATDTADTALDTQVELNVSCLASETCGPTNCHVTAWQCIGQCEVASCARNYWDWNETGSDGCEQLCLRTIPANEICDGLDNDCDGELDTADLELDTQVELDASCGVTACSGCSVSAWQCTNNTCEVNACVSNHWDVDGLGNNGCEYACTLDSPPSETCDGQDDDCDGLIDAADLDLDVDTYCSGVNPCSPCGVEHWSCVAGTCDIASCTLGTSDANVDPDNGCEAACTNQTQNQFCSGHCGTFTSKDNCGHLRTEDCSSCAGGKECGGGGVPNICDDWWQDCAWLDVARIRISTGVDLPLGYSLAVAIPHGSWVGASRSRADGEDVRVLWRNGTAWVEIDRVLDPGTGNSWNRVGEDTIIWFKLQAALAAGTYESSYYLAVHNPSVLPLSPVTPKNEGNVFHFADFFDRAAGDVIGNGWIEDKNQSTDVDIAGQSLFFNITNNANNAPIADRSFPPLTQDLVWRFGFDWIRSLNENTYRMHMQLGNSSAMGIVPATDQISDAFLCKGAGPSLLWTDGDSYSPQPTILDPWDELLGYAQTSATKHYLRVVSGPTDIQTVVRLAAQEYDVLVNGRLVAGDLPFSSAQASLDQVRFFTWQVYEGRFAHRSFAYVLVRRHVTPEPVAELVSPNLVNICP